VATALKESYEQCRRVHRDHGRSYYLATRLLPPVKRRHVHALYAFTRFADEIVDAGSKFDTGSDFCAGSGIDLADREDRLSAWGVAALGNGPGAGPVEDSLLPAVRHTVRTLGLDLGEIDAFLRSMATDLKVTGYATYDDLLGYMAGSAAAIGTLMLPILGVVPGASYERANRSARELGYAFQLTNFIRDVGEDLDRGRIYLPDEDLARFGVTPSTLYTDRERGSASPAVRDLIRYEVGRARVHYANARPGLDLLEPRSRLCIRAAYLLYGSILSEVTRADYDVLARRALVPSRRRALLLLRAATTYSARIDT
jgi:phytoene synthase